MPNKAGGQQCIYIGCSALVGWLIRAKYENDSFPNIQSGLKASQKTGMIRQIDFLATLYSLIYHLELILQIKIEIETQQPHIEMHSVFLIYQLDLYLSLRLAMYLELGHPYLLLIRCIVMEYLQGSIVMMEYLQALLPTPQLTLPQPLPSLSRKRNTSTRNAYPNQKQLTDRDHLFRSIMPELIHYTCGLKRHYT